MFFGGSSPIQPAARAQMRKLASLQQSGCWVNTATPFPEVSYKLCHLEGFVCLGTMVSGTSGSSKSSDDAVYLAKSSLKRHFQVVFNSVRALWTQLIAGGRSLCYLGHQSPTVLTQT